MKRVILVQISYLVFCSLMLLNAQWAKTYGGNENDVVWSPIQQTSDGGYIVIGSTRSFGSGGRDIWALKLDSTGDISPSCGFMESPNAIIAYPYVYPEDTNTTPQSTFVTPLATNASPQDTEATVYLIWPAQEYKLVITATPGGTTELAPDIYIYGEGTRVTITAIPDSGYKFNQWGIDASGTENPITITIDTDKWIAAIFTAPDNDEKNAYLNKLLTNS